MLQSHPTNGLLPVCESITPLNAELNPICDLLALLGAHHIFHVSGLKVNCKKQTVILHINMCVNINRKNVITDDG